MKLPDTCGMKDFSEFVSLGSDYVTAYFALGHRTRPILKTGWDGKALAVLGANGGVGVAAVEVGKVLGAFTLRCTTKTDGDVRKSTAPDGVVDVSRRGWHDRVLEARPGGVDIVFDPVGGDYIFSVLRCMKVGGALLTGGYAPRKVPLESTSTHDYAQESGHEDALSRHYPDGLNQVELPGLLWGLSRALDAEVCELKAGHKGAAEGV